MVAQGQQFVAQRIGAALVGGFVADLLHLAQHQRALVGELVADGLDAGDQFVVGHHFADQAVLLHVRSRQGVTGEQHVLGDVLRNLARQHGSAAATREHAEVGVRVAEAGALGGDHEVAAQHGFQTAGQGHAVDRGDHRFREGTQAVEEGDDGVQQVHFARLRGAAGLQVGAGAERPAGGGQGHHAHVGVDFPAFQALDHRIEHVAVQGVHRLRTGQGDPAHLALHFKGNRLAHFFSSLKWRFGSDGTLRRAPWPDPSLNGRSGRGVGCRANTRARMRCWRSWAPRSGEGLKRPDRRAPWRELPCVR
ncbi:hypothetical protein D9M68_290560 [compost metagenome]